MATAKDLRRLALALDGSVEYPHFDRAAFKAEPADAPDLVGVALRGAKKDMDRATKGLRLHG